MYFTYSHKDNQQRGDVFYIFPGDGEEKQALQKDDQQRALEPLIQEDVPFYDHTITAVRLEDGRIAVVLRWICEVLKLDPQGQVQRIQRTPAIAGELLRVKVQPRQTGSKGGGKQIMPVLTLRGFPTWILGINPNEVEDDQKHPGQAEQIRQTILAYQIEAVDVLYNHFANKARMALMPTSGAAVILAEPIKPPPEANDTEQAAYYEDVAAWAMWKAGQHNQQWRGKVEERQKAIEEEVQSILPQFGLSTEHKETAKHKVLRISSLEGFDNPGSIWNELNTAFGVKTYKNIPDEKWEQVSRWLQRRETMAQRKQEHRGQQPSLFDHEEE